MKNYEVTHDRRKRSGGGSTKSVLQNKEIREGGQM